MEVTMIFKVEKRRSRQNGKLRLTRCCYLRYRIGDMPVDKWKSLGVTDFQVATKSAQRFIQEKEREAAGKAYRSANESASKLVFPNGIPRARRLQKDAEAKGIAYQDELGRFADFHALRYTWATFLQRNGIAQQFAMKLMRHSDIKLTAKVHTDESQLPIYDSIKNLPRLERLYTNTRTDFWPRGAKRVAAWRSE